MGERAGAMLRHLPLRPGKRSRSLTLVTLMTAPLMPRSTTSGWMTCVPTFTEPIVQGIPEGQTVNVVREDTQRKGLLFAGTERAVYVSFDDGDNWESLRLNMPATSIRDLIIKDDDLAVATHGRGFWILDK